MKGALFHRKDIGTEALVTSRVKRMLELQAEAAHEQAAADGVPVVSTRERLAGWLAGWLVGWLAD